MRNKAFFLVIFVLIIVIALTACNKETVFSLDQDTLTVGIGDVAKLAVTVQNYDGEIETTSQDPSIATVDGLYVTGVKRGETTVDVTVGEVTKTVAVTVLASYNQEYVQVEFVIPAPDNNPNIERFSQTISKKCYSNVIKNDSNAALGDVPVPKIPGGYAFNGWYANQAMTEKATFPYALTTQDVVFYGKWIIRDGTKENDSNIQLEYDFDTAEKTALVTGFTYPDVPYENIVIPSTYQNYTNNVKYTVVGIAQDAFKGHPTLKTVKIDTISEEGAEYDVTIGDGAFENCTQLTQLSINHQKLKSVGNHAFFNSGLEKIISDGTQVSASEFSIETIGEDAFYGTAFLRTFTRTTTHTTFPGAQKATQVYVGFLHSKTYLGYDYEYMSNTDNFSLGYDKTITLNNLEVTKVACDFSEQDIRLILIGYAGETDSRNAEKIKQKFIAAGIKEENVEIR